MGIENREPFNNPNQIVILQRDNRLRLANPQVQKERDLVLRAQEEGHLGILTGTERPVIEERYLSQQGLIVSFGLIQEKSKKKGSRISRAALQDTNKRAITALALASEGLERSKQGTRVLQIDINKMKQMLGAGRLGKDVARELGCSRATLVRRIRHHRDELGINIRKGRPRKNTEELQVL